MGWGLNFKAAIKTSRKTIVLLMSIWDAIVLKLKLDLSFVFNMEVSAKNTTAEKIKPIVAGRIPFKIHFIASLSLNCAK